MFNHIARSMLPLCVFPTGGVEIMHLEKGHFKVNAQRLKPYFGGNFHAKKLSITLSMPGVEQ